MDDLVLVAQTIARKVHYRGPEPSQIPLQFLKAFYRAQRAELEQRLLYGKRVASKYDR